MTPQPQHCDHECVCPDYKASHSDWEEDPDPCTISCYHRSRPAPLTQNDGGDCLVICQHCGKVTQVQCDQLPAARIDRENYEDLVYSSTPWTIYRQDAGMGEHDYAVFHNGVFFCRTNHSQTAREIIRAIRA